MAQLRITPFLVINPVIIGISIWSLIRIQLIGGFGLIMSGLFITIGLTSLGLLIVDRTVLKTIKLWIIWLVETMTLIAGYWLVEWYVYS